VRDDGPRTYDRVDLWKTEDGQDRIDTIDVDGRWPLSEKLQRIRKRVDEAPLRFGQQCVKCDRGLAGSGGPREADELSERYIQINVLEIVDSGPSNLNAV